ncbi:MAG: glycosyltransferase [archaeon]
MVTVLKDTCLCAIVRDEKMNPAGGVERFLRAHLPYVEEAVVVDTGSTDGTCEVLEKLGKEFAHLKVYDVSFKDYAHSRNFSLTKVKTKWALVLDADELLIPSSFEAVEEDKERLKGHIQGFSFAIQNIFFTTRDCANYWALHNPRLFNNRLGFKYANSVATNEWLYDFRGKMVADSPSSVHRISTDYPIIHFKSSDKGIKLKEINWYDQLSKKITAVDGPAKIAGFEEWKKLNPYRAHYPG